MRVDEAASFLRKQLAMNADKCWRERDEGFTPDPKCMLIKSLWVTKADLYAESVDGDNEFRIQLVLLSESDKRRRNRRRSGLHVRETSLVLCYL